MRRLFIKVPHSRLFPDRKLSRCPSPPWFSSRIEEHACTPSSCSSHRRTENLVACVTTDREGTTADVTVAAFFALDTEIIFVRAFAFIAAKAAGTLETLDAPFAKCPSKAPSLPRSPRDILAINEHRLFN